MKSNSRLQFYMLLFSLFLMGIGNGVAYSQTISGVVSDAESGETLPGVNIVVKGTTIGTATGPDGSYQLSVNSVKDTLVFSFIGYQTKEVPISSRSEIDLAMEPEVYSGEEMVVVGYGQQNKVSTTGAISQVTGSDISEVPTSDLGNALTGQVGGLTTIQTTGQPGLTDPDVFLRGISSFNNVQPLVIIDGIPSSMRELTQLEPSSVESLSILKDASATAVYGVRGANGVIIATTKRGQDNDMKISANFSVGLQAPSNFLEFTDSYGFAEAHNRAALSDAGGDSTSANLLPAEMVEAWRTGSDPLIYPNIDWWGRMVNNTAYQTKNNINISGGTENARYFLSFGYLDQGGIFDTDIGGPAESYNFNYKRYNINANIDFSITPTTQIKVTSKGRVGKRREPRADGTGGDFWNAIIAHSIPYGSAGVVDGKFIETNPRYYPFNIQRTAIQQFYGQGYRDESENRYDLNLEIQQGLDFWVEGLEFGAKASYKSDFTEVSVLNGGNFPVYLPLYKTDAPLNSVPGDSSTVFQKRGSEGSLNWGGNYNINRELYWEASLRYRQNFGKNELGGVLVYNQSKDYYPGGSYPDIPSGYVGSAARATYNYDERYLAEINLGYNGSENFAEGRRFGLFPAVSGGWVVSNEKLMQEITFLDHLKFRASWGKVGNDRIGGGRFLYLPDQYRRTSNMYQGYNFGVDIPEHFTGATVAQIGNQNVSWETATKQNYGIDIRLFEDRLTLKADYFTELRENILMARNVIPAFLDTPLDLPPVNIGKVRNQGYELEVGWSDEFEDFSYFLSGNWSFAKNKILFMDEIPPNEPYQKQTGKPLGTNFGFIVEGFYTEENIGSSNMPENELLASPKPGDLLYKDLNGDGVINVNDQTAIGYPRAPQVNFGANIGFNFKGFDIKTVWQGVSQVSRALSGAFRRPWTDTGPVLQWMADNSWTPERAANGKENLLPRLTNEAEFYNYRENSTMWIRDASYLRLKNAMIGYTIPANTTEKLGLRNLRIYVNGYNLLTFKKPEYKSLDPEKSRGSNSNLYPLVKVFNLGIDIDF